MEKTGPKVTHLSAAFAEVNSSCFYSNDTVGVSVPCSSTRRASRKDGSRWTTGGSCTSKILWYWSSRGLQTPKYDSPSWRWNLCRPEWQNLCLPSGPAPGCLRTGRGVPRVQREQLHRAAGPSPERPGPPLAVRDHHRDAGQEVPVCLRDRRGPERLDCRVAERHRPTHAASGVRRWVESVQVLLFIHLGSEYVFFCNSPCSGGIFQAQTVNLWVFLRSCQCRSKNKGWAAMRERPKYTVGAFKKEKKPCFPPGLMHVTHVSCHRSLPQPSSVRVFGCQNQNFVQHCCQILGCLCL